MAKVFGGRRGRRVAARECTPHFLWSCQRKRAVHGPKEKRLSVQIYIPWHMGCKFGDAGPVTMRLAETCRVSSGCAICRRSAGRLCRIWHFGCRPVGAYRKGFRNGPADAMPAFEHPRFGRMLSAPTGAAGAKCCASNPVGRDDPGPLGGKFSANFPAYKNFCRGGYQPPGFRRHPRFGRILSAPAGAAGGAAGAKCCTANPAGRGIWGRGCTLAGNLWRLVSPVLWAP